MKYKVLTSFCDKDDNGCVYWAGSEYPREGYEPSEERISCLQGEHNPLKTPVIAKAPEAMKKPKK